MNYLQFIVLFCLHRLNGERSLSAVYHLLSGKKSAQTLQDSKWYRLDSFFGVIKDIDKEDIYQAFQELREKGFVEFAEGRFYKLTDKGEKWLGECLQQRLFPPYLNGLKYHQQARLFWYRLSLVVQTVSNLLKKQKFEPIHRHEETFSWVKRYFFSEKRGIQKLANMLYDEMHMILSSLSKEEATIFLLRLTSHERIGWTDEQIAIFLEKEPLYVQLMFQNALHYMMAKVERNKHLFPALYELLSDLCVGVPLTMSTRKTYEWLMKGKNIEQIAKLRKLKQSTIEDHVVEIAANVSDFPIERFVETKTIQKIMKTAEHLQSKRLKKIREALGGNVSYFAIRLVLAKFGGKHEH